MRTPNLNTLTADDADGTILKRAALVLSETTKTTVLFDDLEASAVSFINYYPVIIGCVAWLTNKPILRALGSREQASIVVQKEDFLRPDAKPISAAALRKLYRSLWGVNKYAFPTHDLSYGLGDLEGVRCAGYGPGKKTQPRMHHKFMVGGVMGYEDPDGDPSNEVFVPKSVWTGSFNFTYNGTQSLENAVVLEDPSVAEAFTKEWTHVVSLSEPLDWESNYVEPEYRWGS